MGTEGWRWRNDPYIGWYPISFWDSSKWEIGKWRKKDRLHDGLMGLCSSDGFHACKKLSDVYLYVPWPKFIGRVEVAGNSTAGCDKEVWQKMRIVKVWRISVDVSNPTTIKSLARLKCRAMRLRKVKKAA
jgi:hypothetical protein